jgi:hypothetical protein
LRTSSDTVLRHLRRASVRKRQSKPRVVGIDDWAIARGHNYGTIVGYNSPRHRLLRQRPLYLLRVTDWFWPGLPVRSSARKPTSAGPGVNERAAVGQALRQPTGCSAADRVDAPAGSPLRQWLGSRGGRRHRRRPARRPCSGSRPRHRVLASSDWHPPEIVR